MKLVKLFRDMKNRITKAFDDLRAHQKHGFIPFITAGDPDLQKSLELMLMLSEEGATVIELGIPFSDPMADGPVIQKASDRALKNNFGIPEILEMIAQFRTKSQTPLILFSYFNPLLQYGLERLCKDAEQAGVDGFLITDLIPEEADEFLSLTRSAGLDMIFLAAPTSSDQRLKAIAEKASGFIYAVSRTGVTGQQKTLNESAQILVSRIKNITNLPVAVGFGISTPAQIREVWRYAEAAVVGSAIVNEVEKHLSNGNLVEEVRKFVRVLIPSEVT